MSQQTVVHVFELWEGNPHGPIICSRLYFNANIWFKGIALLVQLRK